MTDLIDVLCREYGDWIHEQGLRALSADELVHEDITDEQRKWLLRFIERWNIAIEDDEAQALAEAEAFGLIVIEFK